MTRPRNHKNMNSIIYKNCSIADDVYIGDYSVLGKPSRPKFDHTADQVRMPDIHGSLEMTRIGSGCYIDSHVVIEEGVTVCPNCIVESRATIKKGTEIGKSTLIVHGSHICGYASIAEHCVVGGFIADHSVIGPFSRVFGMLLHKQDDPILPWDDNIEGAPVLEDYVFVGMGAAVIGKIRLGRNVYVCANAVVTKDVPAFHIVRNLNDIMPLDAWTGNLRESRFWLKEQD